MSEAIRFGVTIHRNVEAELDQRLGFDVASQVISDLLKRLPVLPFEERQDRDADEADAFHYQPTYQAYGTWRFLDFTVNDGWEPDHLHVIAVVEYVGRRVILPGALGPLE